MAASYLISQSAGRNGLSLSLSLCLGDPRSEPVATASRQADSGAGRLARALRSVGKGRRQPTSGWHLVRVMNWSHLLAVHWRLRGPKLIDFRSTLFGRPTTNSPAPNSTGLLFGRSSVSWKWSWKRPAGASCQRRHLDDLSKWRRPARESSLYSSLSGGL